MYLKSMSYVEGYHVKGCKRVSTSFRSQPGIMKLKQAEVNLPSAILQCYRLEVGKGFWSPLLLFIFSVGSFWQLHSVQAGSLDVLRGVLNHILDIWPHVTPT